MFLLDGRHCAIENYYCFDRSIPDYLIHVAITRWFHSGILAECLFLTSVPNDIVISRWCSWGAGFAINQMGIDYEIVLERAVLQRSRVERNSTLH